MRRQSLEVCQQPLPFHIFINVFFVSEEGGAARERGEAGERRRRSTTCTTASATHGALSAVPPTLLRHGCPDTRSGFRRAAQPRAGDTALTRSSRRMVLRETEQAGALGTDVVLQRMQGVGLVRYSQNKPH